MTNQGSDKPGLVVDADWLRAHRDDCGLVLIDTRAAADFWAGHLAGARHFDPFLFHHYDTSENGLREFASQLEWLFSALGIAGSETVVFYENEAGMRAARGVWMLDYAGHRATAMLDGGLRALGGERLVEGATPVTPAPFKARLRPEVIASFDYVLRKLYRPEARLFDVRSDAEYYAEKVRARRGGAIPGAVHLDWVHCLDANGAFKSTAELKAGFEKLGLSPDQEVITYCQGGYRAAHTYLALKMAGFERVRNYLGSWGEWGNRDDLPIELPKRAG